MRLQMSDTFRFLFVNRGASHSLLLIYFAIDFCYRILLKSSW